jgi:hypothetical protein
MLPVSARASRPDFLTEKRKQKRTSLTLEGKIFVPQQSIEEDCRVLDFSPDGAGVKSSIPAPVGTRLVLYVDRFGRFEGTVVTRDRTRLGVQFHCSSAKRARTAEQILQYVLNGTTARVQLRTTLRAGEVPPLQDFVLADGRHASCKVIDIALGGASLRTEARPEIGELLNFGSASARVVRHMDQGIAVQFVGRQAGASPL